MVKELLLAVCMLFIQQPQKNLLQTCQNFNEFNTLVRDKKIAGQQALLQWQQHSHVLYEKSKPYVDKRTAQWVFPLRGYSITAVGGKNGSGYMAKGFNYFDGNAHRGHAAHDIFIVDRDQNSLDDRTQKPVDVLAVMHGVVVATDSAWSSGSPLRGGNYIYLYNPHTAELVYYAHNSRLLVKPGDVVRAGQKIAEVGRSGKNAAQKRSPTHLHITAFHVTDAGPQAFNCFSRLQQARFIQ